MNYEVVWLDKFDQKDIDKTKWTYDVGGHGFGNAEAQFYTDRHKNVRVEDEMLVIEAHKESFHSNSYTSGKLTTEHKFTFQYGRVDVKAKVPKGFGTWPAIWMMPEAFKDGMSWPRCGEIDIMEHIGRNEDEIHFSLHTEMKNHMNKTQDTFFKTFKGITDRFAVFSTIWAPDYIEFLIDEVSYIRINKHKSINNPIGYWPFDQAFYIIINLALGGYWGGDIDDSMLPAKFYIDYIKVSKLVE